MAIAIAIAIGTAMVPAAPPADLGYGRATYSRVVCRVSDHRNWPELDVDVVDADCDAPWASHWAHAVWAWHIFRLSRARDQGRALDPDVAERYADVAQEEAEATGLVPTPVLARHGSYVWAQWAAVFVWGVAVAYSWKWLTKVKANHAAHMDNGCCCCCWPVLDES